MTVRLAVTRRAESDGTTSGLRRRRHRRHLRARGGAPPGRVRQPGQPRAAHAADVGARLPRAAHGRHRPADRRAARVPHRDRAQRPPPAAPRRATCCSAPRWTPGRFSIAPQRIDVADIVSARRSTAATPVAEAAGVELDASVTSDARSTPTRSGSRRPSTTWSRTRSSSRRPAARSGSSRRPRGVGAARIIVVADTGIGIPPDELSQLTTRFFRASTATRRAIPGVGLGLSITKAVVDAHGGTLTITSTLGEGTTFTITLPATPPGLRRTARVTSDISGCIRRPWPASPSARAPTTAQDRTTKARPHDHPQLADRRGLPSRHRRSRHGARRRRRPCAPARAPTRTPRSPAPATSPRRSGPSPSSPRATPHDISRTRARSRPPRACGSAVQGTGHGATETMQDAILVSTAALDEVTVHADERWARIGAGVRWAAVLEACAPYGLAGPGRLVAGRRRRRLPDRRRARPGRPDPRARVRHRPRVRGRHRGRRGPPRHRDEPPGPVLGPARRQGHARHRHRRRDRPGRAGGAVRGRPVVRRRRRRRRDPHVEPVVRRCCRRRAPRRSPSCACPTCRCSRSRCAGPRRSRCGSPGPVTRPWARR